MKTDSVFLLHYDNNLDAFIPEMWAMESVALLVENMVASNLVHRDFEMEFARHGDTVNTRQPANFTAKRKINTDTVTIQDATATNIPVKLDQHVHTSFLIHDGDETRSFLSLVNEYLRPAAISMARFADQVVLGQYVHFLANQAGSLGGLTNSNGVQYISEVGLEMNRNKAHATGRQQIWTPEAQSLLIQHPTFHQAERLGDDGTALRTASLGEKLNFRHWMAQNMSQLNQVNAADETGAVDLTAGYAKGATALHVDGLTTDTADVVLGGQFLTINGKVYQLAANATSTGTDADITLTYGLKEAVANDDVIEFWPATNLAVGAYAAGYLKYITIDDGSGGAPAEIQVGQAVSFGGDNYTVIDVVGSTILLDRALETAIVDNDPCFYGPEGGGYNMAFHKNAITLAVRPLAPPRSGTGALSAVVNLGGVPMRVVITYDGDKQGHLVTLDFLAGVKVLDTDLGALALS